MLYSSKKLLEARGQKRESYFVKKYYENFSMAVDFTFYHASRTGLDLSLCGYFSVFKT